MKFVNYYFIFVNIQIERFDQLTRDQLVCVSTTKTFIPASKRQHDVDIKANWARTRNKYGDQATDIRVNTNVSSFPQSVDPFGPPLLTLDDRQQQQQTSLRAFNKPPIVPATSNRRLAIQQKVSSSTVIQEITSPYPMEKDSLVLNENINDDQEEDDDDDDETDSEIQRITKSNNDDDDQSSVLFKSESKTQKTFSTLLTADLQSLTTNTNDPFNAKSDNDDEDDDFIRMLKGK